MLTKIALVALVVCSLITPSFAKTVTEEKSGVMVDLPEGEGWKMEESKDPTALCDEGLTIVVMRFDKDLPAVVLKRIADKFEPMMRDAKVGDDSEQITVHGIQADKISGYGMKDEKPVKFTAILLSKDSSGTTAIIAYGAETPFKRHLRDIDTTLDSVRPKQ